MSKKSHRKVIIIGSIASVMMFGFCFAMVPLYSIICKVTGINTSVRVSELTTPAQTGKPSATEKVDLSREVTVQFVAVNNMGMPWEFYPRLKSVTVHPGENKKVTFYAKNTTDKLMTVQAVPSMTPVESIGHFHKIECFCFTQQTLKGGEDKDMALIFNLDKDLPKDVHVITLAYTLFDATPRKTSKG
jgi:cytochrome c oxidase assembly protein subunit 11